MRPDLEELANQTEEEGPEPSRAWILVCLLAVTALVDGGPSAGSLGYTG